MEHDNSASTSNGGESCAKERKGKPELVTPMMSIHRLKYNESQDPFDFITSIIKKHNKKIKNETKNKKKNETKNGAELDSEPQPYRILPSNKVKEINQGKESFTIKIFIQLTFFKSKFTKCYIDDRVKATESQEIEGIEIQEVDQAPTESISNAIIFYYRPECVFAVTKLNSWHVVQPYSDFEFPFKMAKLLLNQEGSKCLLLKHVIGDNVTTQSLKKRDTPIPSDPLDPVICLNFTAALEKNVRLRKLLFLPDEIVNVSVGLGRIRFMKGFTPKEWVILLNHLDLIYKQKDEGGAGSKAFRQCLQAVDTNIHNSLYAELHRILFNVFEGITDVECNFELFHKYSQDFHLSTEYYLVYRNYEPIKLNGRPDLKNILTELKSLKQVVEYMDQPRKVKGKPLDPMEKFRTVFANTKIEFLKGNRSGKDRYHSEKLMSFIEGSVVFEGRLYWRVLNMWCTVYSNYFKYIHHEFLKCLRKKLLKTTDPLHLSAPWLKEVSEGNYNKFYASKPGFYLGDCITPPPYKIEFFDLMYIHPVTNAVYFYHIKDDFDGKSRIACEQFLVSLRTKTALLNELEDYLLIYHKEFIQNNFPHGKKYEIPDQLRTLNSFKKTFKNATYVIAFRSKCNIPLPTENLESLFFKTCTPQSLHLEMLLKEKVDANDFIRPIKENGLFYQLQRGFKPNGRMLQSVDEMATNIVEVLSKENMINSESEATDLIIYYTDDIIVNLLKNHMNDTSAKIVCTLLKQYRTQFGSFIAKLQLLRLNKETYGKFLICDISRVAVPESEKDGGSSDGKRQLEIEEKLEKASEIMQKKRKKADGINEI